MKKNVFFTLLIFLLLLVVSSAYSQRRMEKLGRGTIAMRQSGGVYVGWRMLGTEPNDVTYNVYRASDGGDPVLLNSTPLKTTTDYFDATANATVSNLYTIRAIIKGVEQAPSAGFTLAANTPIRQYLGITETQPFVGVVYQTTEVRPADVDGDGEFEYIITRQSPVMSSVAPPDTKSGYIVQCYKLGVGCLWTLKLGVNLSSTSSIYWLNLGVADFDGDGKCEVMIKTAEGTTFQYGTADESTIGDTNGDGKTDYRETNGWVLTGPEFLSVVDAVTGKELARTDFKPSIHPDPTQTAVQYWGLNERPFYLWTGVGFLDGVLPSFVATCGWDIDRQHVYTYDYRNGKITERWHFLNNFHVAEDGSKLPSLSLAGTHTIWIGDLNNDGKDDIDFGPWALNSDGKILYQSGLVHGDHFRIADMDPDRPGLEHYMIQQYNGDLVGQELFEAMTGKAIKKWFLTNNGDVSRGTVGDFDPRYKGMELYSTMGGMWNATGKQTCASHPFPTKEIWWDSDLLREHISGANAEGTTPILEKVNYLSGGMSRIFVNGNTNLYSDNGGVHQIYGGEPPFWGDILGDWREELMLENSANTELRIYSTVNLSTTRLYALMQNPQYRANTTNRGRRGGEYTDYYLGVGMEVPAPPPITDATYLWNGNSTNTFWANGSGNFLDNNLRTETTYADGNSVLFDLTGGSNTLISLEGEVKPSKVTVYSPIDYSFIGTGKLTGEMEFTKVGKGTLTLNQANDYTGKTEVWDGALIVNSSLNSPVVVHGGTWGGYMATGLTGGRIGGTGTLSQSLILTYGAAIVPGNGMNSAGKFTVNGDITERNYAVNCFDLSKNADDALKNDLLYIKGNLTISDTTTFIVINPTDGVLDLGTFTLIQYEGTFTGDITKIVVKGIEGTAYSLKNENNKILLVIEEVRHPSSIVWKGGLNNNEWNMVKTENFLKNNTLTKFVSGDAVVFDQTGIANNVVNVVGTLPVSDWTVNSSYTFNGEGIIAGTSGLTKNGIGTLTINTQNSFTGPVVVNDGVLAVNNLNEAGSNSAIGAASADASNFMLNGATFRILGTAYTNRNMTLTNTNTIDVPNASDVFTLTGAMAGNASLIKTGAGTITLTNTNTYTGGTIIKEGRVILGSEDANVTGLGTGTITLQNATLNLFDNIGSYTTVRWNLIVPAGYTATLNNDGRCVVAGTLTGGGTLNFNIPDSRTEVSGNWSEFEGQLNTNGDMATWCDFRILSSTGFAKATLNINNAAYHTTASTNVALGALTGTGTLSNTNWTIGAKNINTTFAGVISGTALTKVGTGSQTLTGANTYTGATTINGGKLIIDGSLKSAVTINGNGTLDGKGVVAAAVSVNGGTIAVGNGFGILSVNTVSMTASSKMNIELNKAIPAGEMLKTTTASLNGTLVVSNVGAAYAAGDVFTILTGAINGTFAAIEPAQPAAGLSWDLSSISTGVLKVVASALPYVSTSIVENKTNANVTITTNQTGRVYYSLTDQTQATLTTNGLFVDVTANVPTTIVINNLLENSAYTLYSVLTTTTDISYVSKTSFVTSIMLNATMSTVTINSAVVSVTPYISGKVYYMVLPNATTAPSSADVVAQMLTTTIAKGSVNCASNTALSLNLTGLSAATSYKVYIVGQNTANGFVTPLAFTTLTNIPTGTITLNGISQTGVNVSLTPNAAGTVRFVVLKASDAVPSADAIISQDLGAVVTKNMNCSANIPVVVDLSGLSAATAYKVYAVVINVNNQVSTVLSVAATTNDFAPVAQAFLNKTTFTEASIDLKSNVAGKVYYVLLKSTDPSPSTADAVITPSNSIVKGNVLSVVNEYQTLSFSTLESATSYKLYVVAQNANSQSSPVATLEFTTKTKITPVAEAALTLSTTAAAYFDVKSNVVGKLYYVLFKSTDASPTTAMEVISPSASSIVNGASNCFVNEIQNLELYNLESATSYKLFVLTQNGYDEYSAITSLEFATKSGVDVSHETFDNEVKLYPNPANSTVTVSYVLNKNSNVNGELYSVDGKKLLVIDNTTLNAGKHTTTFDVSQLTNGMYFYQLRTNSGVITKKLVIKH